ncbi:hypothetical protein JCM8547_003944 [Rhodosporidiobolus lusitaniae]
MSSTLTVNESRSKPSTTARQAYQSATRAFLERDYRQTALHLQLALDACPRPDQRQWFDSVVSGVPEGDSLLRRKLETLHITFLATVRASPTPAIAAGEGLAPLLEQTPGKLVQSLWHSLLSSAEGPASEDADILPTPLASFLHPSLALSLAFAALKLDEPRLARQAVEAWIGSVDAEVEKIVWETSERVRSSGGSSFEEEFPLDAVGSSSGGANGMSGSGILGTAGTEKDKMKEARKAVVGGWLKLLDLLVLHILPQLGEWEAAGDFVRLQSVENGGWVPDERVEAALHRLTELQHDETLRITALAQRQRDLEAARAEKKREREPRRPSADSSSMSKGKARDTSPTTSSGSGSGSVPTTSPKKAARRSRGEKTSTSSTPKASPPLSSSPSSSTHPTTSGFGGLRSSLSSYLARPSSSSSQANGYPPSPTASPANPLASLISYLRHSYSADPLRVLSIVTFLFAFLTWARRRVLLRRARGERGLGLGEVLRLAAGKVGETVRMATKVTAL